MDLQLIFDLLFERYGPQGWWPLHGKHSGKQPSSDREVFEIIIGAVLTQNTSWNNVEKALWNLRSNGMISRQKIAESDEKVIANLIRPAGYYNQKARKLKIVAKSKAKTRKELLDLWGIGPETADSIMLYAFGKPYFVIDAYTKRIFSRIGIKIEKKGKNYSEWQDFFMSNLPKNIELYKEYHALIVEHAKRHCRSKPVCSGCVLRKICGYCKDMTSE